jgi:type IV pilus biogenesis protein CpaD/CtpE
MNMFKAKAGFLIAALITLPLTGCVEEALLDDAKIEPYSGSDRYPIKMSGSELHVAKCGKWQKNLAETSDNKLNGNHGCAVQSNIAAMAAYPEDITVGRTDMPATDGDFKAGDIQQLYSDYRPPRTSYNE